MERESEIVVVKADAQISDLKVGWGAQEERQVGRQQLLVLYRQIEFEVPVRCPSGVF